jgi:hypothetical protein
MACTHMRCISNLGNQKKIAHAGKKKAYSDDAGTWLMMMMMTSHAVSHVMRIIESPADAGLSQSSSSALRGLRGQRERRLPRQNVPSERDSRVLVAGHVVTAG